VDAAGIVLKSITVSVCAVSVCLQILNSFNISGMDEATLFKFGKWIDYSKSHSGWKISPGKWRGLGHVIVFEILNPLQYIWNGSGYAV